MTDETTARDRAIDIVTAELPRGQKYVSAYVVDALLAHPVALCALAGAPTADVAAVNGDEQLALQEDIHEAQHAVHGTCCIDQDDATSCELLADVLSRRGWRRAAPAVEPEGMDVEAQGGMADELTAAQAANERVRALCSARQSFLAPNEPALTVPEILRALDGDTTEEN